jgi:hypothetical protein
MDCHSMHLEVETRFVTQNPVDWRVECQADGLSSFKKAGAMNAYYRFDVDIGLESVGLNESDEDALQHISAVTQAYIKGHAEEMARCAQLIRPRNSTLA